MKPITSTATAVAGRTTALIRIGVWRFIGGPIRSEKNAQLRGMHSAIRIPQISPDSFDMPPGIPITTRDTPTNETIPATAFWVVIASWPSTAASTPTVIGNRPNTSDTVTAVVALSA